MRIQAAHVRPFFLAIFLIVSRLSFSKDMCTVLVCPTFAVFVLGCVVIFNSLFCVACFAARLLQGHCAE